jgi:surface antigen/Ni/Co efflux regulator RcnB
MKTHIMGALLAVTLSTSVAHAQRSDRDYPRDDGTYEYRDNRGGNRGERQWSRGDRVSRDYLDERYSHHGWQNNKLRQPRRGERWLVIGRQFVLVARDGRVLEVAVVPRRDEGRGWGYGGNREEQWRNRYKRTYTYNDDVAYTECRDKPDPAGVLVGALLGAALGNTVAGRRDRGAATVAGVIAGGAIGAALTKKMDCDDRSYAYKAYSDGFNSGRPGSVHRWENPQNRHRGELRVLDYYNDEDRFRCAAFSQTVYINGRPEEARGRACQQPDGTWAIID